MPNANLFHLNRIEYQNFWYMNRPIYIRSGAVVSNIGTFIKIINAWFKISIILLNIATNRQMPIYFHLNRIEYQNFWYMNRHIYIRMVAVVSKIGTFIKIVNAWFKIGTILLNITTNRQMLIYFHLNRIEYQNFWYMNRTIYIGMGAVISKIGTFIKS